MLNHKRNRTTRPRLGWLLFASAMLLLAWASEKAAMAQDGSTFSTLDLSPYYTDSVTGTNARAAIPQGKQTFNGVPFLLGGRIELTGMNAARNGDFQPAEINGIPVNQKASRLHLLLGARHGQKDGTPLASVLLHFKNGEARSLRLAYGLHARNSYNTNETSMKAFADPNTVIGWQSASDTNGTVVRLYHAILANPLPEEEVSSLDLVSLFNAATPIVFSATMESGKELRPLLPLVRNKVVQHAAQFEDSVYRRQLTLRVTDPSGQPLPDASALVTLQDDSQSYFFGQYRRGKQGLIQISYPPQDAVALNVRVTSPGLVPMVLSRTFNDRVKDSESVEVVLQRGITIGGLVVDPSGKGISNASVIPYMVRSTGVREYTRTDLTSVQTRSDGTWSAAALAETITNLNFEVAHPEYRRALISTWSAADLLAAKAKIVLQPHVVIIGRVLNEQGNPLGKSTVILDQGSNHTWQYTDGEGRFKFVVPDSTNKSAGLIAIATNLAPLYQVVSLKSNSGPFELKLDPGQKFTMRLLDQDGQPVPKVKISLTSWAGSKAMQWSTETDSSGRFNWDHAPNGQAFFRFEKPGYIANTHSVSLPNPGETSMTYSRRVTVAGRVLDAETQKPLDQFRARIRYRYQNGSGSTSTTGRKGSFSTYLGGNKYQETTVTIEARGYQPVRSTLPPDENGSYSNLFLLHKAIPIPGFVLAPDGTPAVGAEVVLLDNSSYAYMEESGKFRRGYSDYEVTLTDANGRFELTPKLDPDVVVAVHRTLGFGQIRASNILAGAKVTLKPWGHIKGVLKVGDKVEANHYVAVQSANSWSPTPDEPRQTVYTYLKMKPSADGQFAFDAVPPGSRTVSLRYMSEEQRDYGPTRLSHTVSVEVKSGETNDVLIGGTGRTVTGKLECSGPSAQRVDWRLYAQTLRPTFRNGAMVRPRIPAPNATAAERKRINEEYIQASEEANRKQRIQYNITYVLLCEADGTFRIPNLPAGDYSLNVYAVIPSGSSSYQHVGNLNQTVTVPEGTTPYDLGKFVVKANQ